jgi:hypothetical protein
MIRRTLIALALASAITAPVVLTTSASASVPAPSTVVAPATTQISNRPDGGNHGIWALDNFTRTATVTIVGEVAASNCPGTDTGHCYLWNFTIADAGHFTAQSGDLAPRSGSTLERTLTGRFSGGASHGQIYASWKTARATRVPLTEDDQGLLPAGRHTTTNWVEQFFGASATFGAIDLGNWSWTYTLGFNANDQCPNNAYRWVDAAANSDGSLPADGDILTPTSANC